MLFSVCFIAKVTSKILEKYLKGILNVEAIRQAGANKRAISANGEPGHLRACKMLLAFDAVIPVIAS